MENIFYYVSESATENLGTVELLNAGESFGVIPLSKFDMLKNDIYDFTNLEEDWDGYGGVPLLPEIAETANKLIAMLASDLVNRISDIYPNSHGTVTIEWQNWDQEKLSLEIGRNNYSYFVKFTDQKTKLVHGEDILSDFKQFTSDLGELFNEELLRYFF